MTALASSDVTVTINDRDKDVGHGALLKNMTIAQVQFGDGSLTYPTGGVPLPAKENFGFLNEIAFGAVQESAVGFVYKYDQTNHKIKIFTQGLVSGSTTGVTIEDGATAAKVEDSAGSEGDLKLAGATPDTTYDVGALIELPSTVAPASATLKLFLVGD